MSPDSRTSIEHAQSYRAAFSQMQPTATTAPWLQALRKRALQEFIDRGFPTTAEENWRYTDLTCVAQRSFDYLDGSPQERASRRSLHQYRSPQRAACSLPLTAWS